MSLTEPERHQIIQWFQEQMGPERGELMMKAIAPVGWADIVTRRDLAEMETRLDLRFQTLEHKLDAKISSEVSSVRIEVAELRAELHRSLRTQTYMTLGGASVIVSVIAAVSQLFG